MRRRKASVASDGRPCRGGAAMYHAGKRHEANASGRADQDAAHRARPAASAAARAVPASGGCPRMRSPSCRSSGSSTTAEC